MLNEIIYTRFLSMLLRSVYEPC